MALLYTTLGPRRRDELGISYIVLNTNIREHTEQLAPVIAALAGT